MLAKLNAKDQEQVHKFELYKEFSGKISHIKPYQILALNRGENLSILSVKIEKTEESGLSLQSYYARLLSVSGSFSGLLQTAYDIGYTTLFDSVENEIRGELEEKAQDDAIETFQKNLGQLLLTKPEYGKRILAIDPGFKAGCKLVVLDAGGNPLAFEKIFLFQKEASLSTLAILLGKYPVDVIVLGNGTGSSETLELLQELFSSEKNVRNAGMRSEKSYVDEKIVGNENIHYLQDNIFIVNES